ncbi:hypothetical protein AeMF1_017725 [Aphanomyces euteiches]|nr:hypothetical protein AeMF1_017725 [Aphanomyces euteiches]
MSQSGQLRLFDNIHLKFGSISAIMSIRGANFTQDDDCQLARSWINIAEDNVKGSGQKMDQFWARIAEHFNEHSQSPVRSARSLSARWSLLNEQCNKFVGCYALAKSNLASGESVGQNESELIRKAMAIFSKRAGSSGRSKETRFVFLHVWEILKSVKKWQDLRNVQVSCQKSSKRMKLNENDEVVPDTEATTERPVGNKAAKKARIDAVESSRNQNVVAQSQLIRAQAMSLQAELSLMTVPMDGLTDTAKEYILLKQAAVLQNTRGRRDRKSIKSASSNDEDYEIVEVV